MRVSDVLNPLASPVSIDELLADFVYLSREYINACLAYAARAIDHSVVQPPVRLLIDAQLPPRLCD